MSGEAAESVAPEAHPTVAEYVVELLWDLGVRHAFGVTGREIAAVWQALFQSDETEHPIVTIHARHENGAGYAAVGAWHQSGCPSAMFVTTAPGLTNAMTSLETARAVGAKIVLLSPLTAACARGRLGIQDTGPRGFDSPDRYSEGRLFDLVATIASVDELRTVTGHLSAGMARAQQGFMAHVAIATDVQNTPTEGKRGVPVHRVPAPGATPELIDEIVRLLAAEPFAVWVGAGARHHAEAIRRLLDLTGAPAMSSPRGLGVVGKHPQFIGVTGNGGHASVFARLKAAPVARTLVLGSGLGMATTGGRPELIPPAGFIHVDLDSRVFAKAHPEVETLAVQAEIGAVLDGLLARSGDLVRREPAPRTSRLARLTLVPDRQRPVHPAALMAAIQRVVVNETDMPVLADAASAMFWGARYLEFDEPGRWWVENRWGAMGNAAGAVIGMAVSRGGPALAIVGDAAMHMQDELNTAAQYGIRAIWVVLNDSGMGIVREGTRIWEWPRHEADFPETDFAAVAAAKGVTGVRVTSEEDLDRALREAVDATGPVLVDIIVDRDVAPPIEARGS
ncbi:MAG TPA: thiamine pyrophosphate-binding protein [Solirubrobacteraceae bacterium]|nr:thiamine pyrophosphate-binding protein [Solirubrobacteraceae bacterium]